jgi:hypothetical protein
MTTPARRRRGARACPRGWSGFTGRLLGKDPADRPASAAATRAGLLATLAPDATAVLPAQVGGPVPDDPVRRRRARPARTPRCPLGRLLRPPVRGRPPAAARPQATALPRPPRRRARSSVSCKPGSPTGRSPSSPGRTCSAACSRCCSARRARTPSRSSSPDKPDMHWNDRREPLLEGLPERRFYERAVAVDRPRSVIT